MWEVLVFGEVSFHYRECADNRFDVVRCTPCEMLGGPGNWHRVAPLFVILDTNQQLSRFDRLRRALETGQTAQAGAAFTLQCGELRRFPKSAPYDPRWNSLRPDVVLSHGRNDPNIWIAKQFRAVFPHLPDAWRTANPRHAWRSTRGPVPIAGTSPAIERSAARAAATAAKEEAKRLRIEGEAAARLDRARAREFEREERQRDVFARKVARERKWAADRKAREEAAEARRRAFAENPTLAWRHPRRKGWLKPDDGNSGNGAPTAA